LSDALVQWVEALPDGTVRDEVTLFDDGTVARAVPCPAFTPSPTMGWFRGVVDDGVLSLARSVAGVDVNDEPGLPRPQAGGWVAATEQASVPLWGEGGSPATATLRSLLPAVVEAASQPETAVRFAAVWTTVGEERAPLLTLDNVGVTPAWCAIDEIDGVTATFLDSDGRALGFLGSSVSLDGGARGAGFLVGWGTGDSLVLSVRLARPDDATLEGNVVVAVAG
jgi:hypothetical protein